LFRSVTSVRQGSATTRASQLSGVVIDAASENRSAEAIEQLIHLAMAVSTVTVVWCEEHEVSR
jgi:hypothetical protein